MRASRRQCAILIASWLLSACALSRSIPQPVSTPQPPSFMLGEFEDDYGERHSVESARWLQRPRNRFDIVRWAPDERFLIARNSSANPGPKGRWSRIDWVALDGMPPYTWAFCFSAFDAPSAAAAESVHVVHPETPKTGCNGHPYTRMRLISAR